MRLEIDMMRIRLEHLREKIMMTFVWHLPKSIIGWAVVRAVAHATQGRWSHEIITDIDSMELIKRWNESNKTPQEQREDEEDRQLAHKRRIENLEALAITCIGFIVLGLLLWLIGILK